MGTSISPFRQDVPLLIIVVLFALLLLFLLLRLFLLDLSFDTIARVLLCLLLLLLLLDLRRVAFFNLSLLAVVGCALPGLGKEVIDP